MFTVQMFSALEIGWACSLLGFVSVVLVPVPWVLYKYGKRIRVHSQYIIVERPVFKNSSVKFQVRALVKGLDKAGVIGLTDLHKS